MPTTLRLPERKDVQVEDTWDLTTLFKSEGDWESAFKQLEAKIGGFAKFQGKLGESAKTLVAALKFESEFDLLAEKIHSYAFLRLAENQADPASQAMTARVQSLMTRSGEARSYVQPELLAIPEKQIDKLLADPHTKHFRLLLERTLRYRPHTLGEREEKLLAMQGVMSQASNKAFRQLMDADMRYGFVPDEKGNRVELSQATLGQLLISPVRSVRKQAFKKFYAQIRGHENTLAATLAGSVHRDVYYSKARGYLSALEASLFHDNIPISVYSSLIESVRRHLPTVHKYYDLRRRKMKLKGIHFYDTYVPILPDVKSKRTWRQACDTVLAALEPLGDEYIKVLSGGLQGRWCDRYPNKGKQSGAFSSGSYQGDPYILMNYKAEVFDDVFTLAHEAGHSMHTYLSAKNQSFEYYGYTIFVAEVASTFNEQLLGDFLMKRAKTKKEKAQLINKEIDNIRATIVRQTMFAEFEREIHAVAEADGPLTTHTFQEIYGKLLRNYLGPSFNIDSELHLECMRIPHFYRAFYVYKYATGLAAAIALSEQALTGGSKAVERYLKFLKGGCSKWPLDLLRDAGVDMETPAPVEVALQRFSRLVEELDEILA